MSVPMKSSTTSEKMAYLPSGCLSTREEAIEMCVERMLPDMGQIIRDATAKVDRADSNPERWEKDCATRDLIHGKPVT